MVMTHENPYPQIYADYADMPYPLPPYPFLVTL